MYAVRQLILQDHHVTYRQIETTLGISGASIHSTLHEDLTAKKFVGIGSQFDRLKKDLCRLV